MSHIVVFCFHSKCILPFEELISIKKHDLTMTRLYIKIYIYFHLLWENCGKSIPGVKEDGPIEEVVQRLALHLIFIWMYIIIISSSSSISSSCCCCCCCCCCCEVVEEVAVGVVLFYFYWYSYEWLPYCL